MNDRKYMLLRKARHPLIDRKKVVPVTVELGGSYDTMVITGPNTGGKTVSLKTVGLMAMMAQADFIFLAPTLRRSAYLIRCLPI